MRFPGSSKLPRVAKCNASAVLPATPSQAGPHAVRGQGIHRFLQDCVELGDRDEALARLEYPGLKAACEKIDTEALPTRDPKAFTAELTMSWRPSTGEFESYPKRPWARGEEPHGLHVGTADLVAISADGKKGYLRDYKTGRGHVPPPKLNWQLMGLALMLARVYGLEEVNAGIIYVWEADSYETHTTFDTMDLDAIEAELEDLFARLVSLDIDMKKGAVPQVSMGPWCKYCPAYASCPGQTRMLWSCIRDPKAVINHLEERLDTGEATEVYRIWKVLHERVSHLGEALRGYALSVGGFPIGDGLMFGPMRQTPRDHLDGTKLFRIMKELHGQDVAIKAIKLVGTKAGIEEALRPQSHPKHNPLKALKQAVLDALREAGGVETKMPEKETVGEYKIKAVR